MKKIKEVSSIVGITKRTLQYYDDEGLLTPIRSSENYRLYDEEDLARAWVIVMYQRMDFKLSDIGREGGLINPYNSDALTLKLDVMKQEISEIERKIRIIKRIQKYGLPPICISHTYKGNANYVGCIDIITKVLGMNDKEIASQWSVKKDYNKIPSYISSEFTRWLHNIDEKKIALVLKNMIYMYCEESR